MHADLGASDISVLQHIEQPLCGVSGSGASHEILCPHRTGMPHHVPCRMGSTTNHRRRVFPRPLPSRSSSSKPVHPRHDELLVKRIKCPARSASTLPGIRHSLELGHLLCAQGNPHRRLKLKFPSAIRIRYLSFVCLLLQTEMQFLSVLSS